MKNTILSFLLPVLIFVSACSKTNTPSANNTVPPSNLTVTANVSTDSSGNVAFIAAATNATSYDFDFGDGGSLNVVSGITTYKYANSGTYTVNVIAKNGSGLIISKSIQVVVVVTQAAIWSDEFNINGAPDASKWTYDLGAGGWGNSELQYYTNRPSNVIVQNGVLKITAVKESYSGSSYTSARIKSQGLYSFTYGRVEISAKLPSAVGTWPALWMLGSNITNTAWPACGEMDIMEQKGNELNKIYGTIHYPGHSGGGGVGSTLTISNSSTQFHKYTLDWSAAAIKMYVDNVLYLTVPNTGSLPFNQNFFFIINMAMGGTFGGTVSPSFTTDTMEVDYIRVYK